MKRVITICLFSLSFNLFGQFTDDFSDGDFINNPSWSGDVGFFIVQNDTLRSNGASSSDILSLSTTSTAIHMTTWEFLVKLDFAPSSSNQVKVYLVSDQADMEGDLNGYFIEIGQSSDDVIKLRRQNGSSSTTVFTGSTIFTGDVLVRIRVSRDDIGNWEVFSDPTGDSDFSSEGAVFHDDTFTTSSYFGLLCKHSSTRNDDFYFDDFLVSVAPDTQPPSLNVIQVVSFNQIDLQFDEALEQTSAELVNNYSVDGEIGQPTSASLDVSDNSLVHLTFASSFTNNATYEITAEQIEDLNGNINTIEALGFNVLIPQAAMARDLVINEIMADNTPPIGLPEADYVEIHNNSNKYIDLMNCALSGSTISTMSYIIAPDQYIILCANSSVSLLQPFGDVIGVSSWNALNQEDETITIMQIDNSLIIDELTYDKSWYNDPDKEDGGWSLELINPDHLCSGDDNWTASENPLGGTPGRINAVFDNTPDLVGPELLSAIVVSNEQLKLTFDEPLDPVSFESAVFTFEPSLTITQIILEDDLSTVTINFSEILQTSTIYTLSISLLKDCIGNVRDIDQEQAFFLTRIANHKEILISEIMADPSPVVGLPDSEYVELLNNSNSYFNLKDYLLNDEDISLSYILAPGQYVALVRKDDISLFSSFENVIGMDDWNALTNSGEKIILKTHNSEEIDVVAYDDSWYNSIVKNEGGWSLEIIDPDNKCGEENNWSASISAFGGTPGRVNSIFGSRPDLTGPKLLSAMAITEDSLILTFNERLDTTSLKSVTYTFEPALLIDHSIVDEALRQITIVFSGPLQKSLDYQVKVLGLKDCNGNIIGEENTKTFVLSELAEQGDLLINELLYNPITSGGDFIEIYNTSAKYINLKGWMIANGSDDAPDNIKLISEEHLLISPRQYFVLTEEPSVVAADYPSGLLEHFVEVSSLPSLPNTEQGVALLSPQSIVLDYFQYDADMQHPLLDDDKGVSLERISFENPTGDRNNWHSASKGEGFATPGYTNSQSLNLKTNVSESIVVSPQVFLPNQSGQDDFATINYSFSQAGFVANVSIVDAGGRTIRIISQNELLSTKGFFQWDGTMDNGRKARSGAYIVLFEAFDVSGNKQMHKKRVVVAAQL